MRTPNPDFTSALERAVADQRLRATGPIRRAGMTGMTIGAGLPPSYGAYYNAPTAYNRVQQYPAGAPTFAPYTRPEAPAIRRQLGLTLPRSAPDLSPLGIARRRFQASIPSDAPSRAHPGDDTGRGA